MGSTMDLHNRPLRRSRIGLRRLSEARYVSGIASAIGARRSDGGGHAAWQIPKPSGNEGGTRDHS